MHHADPGRRRAPAMMLVDANILVYAHVEAFGHHERARSWLDEHLGGTARVGLPWESLTAYMRIVTNPRIFPRPLSASAAMAQVREWLDREAAWTPTPTERHTEFLSENLKIDGIRADLIPDAHLAAIARGHGLTVVSNDSDFARFPKVRWDNPLAEPDD